MSSPKNGDHNMGKELALYCPEPQQPKTIYPFRGLTVKNKDFSIGLGLDFTEPLNYWFVEKKTAKTHPTNSAEARATVCSEPCMKNSLTPSPKNATKPFAPAVNGATGSAGVLNVEDAAAENGSNIDLDLKL